MHSMWKRKNVVPPNKRAPMNKAVRATQGGKSATKTTRAKAAIKTECARATTSTDAATPGVEDENPGETTTDARCFASFTGGFSMPPRIVTSLPPLVRSSSKRRELGAGLPDATKRRHKDTRPCCHLHHSCSLGRPHNKLKIHRGTSYTPLVAATPTPFRPSRSVGHIPDRSSISVLPRPLRYLRGQTPR